MLSWEMRWAARTRSFLHISCFQEAMFSTKTYLPDDNTGYVLSKTTQNRGSIVSMELRLHVYETDRENGDDLFNTCRNVSFIKPFIGR